MKSYLQNDKGYSLLLSICAILIFSIIGLSLMSLTSNGVKKNITREETIQAKDLADKGIDYIVGDIQKTLEEQIKATPMGKTDFEKFLVATLNNPSINCLAEGQPIPDNIGYKIPGENNNFTKVCIDDVEMITNEANITEEKDRYKRIVTFKSVGMVNNIEKTTKSDVIIGTDAIPDQLRYAVSSNDGGSVYFHGGVEVTGDVKSADNVHIIKNAFSGYSNGPSWHDSVALKMNSTVGSSSSKIILPSNENKLHYYTKQLSYNKNGIIYSNASNIFNLNNQDEIRSILTKSDRVNIIAKDVPVDKINVKSKVETVYNDKKYNSALIGKKSFWNTSRVEGNTHNLNNSEDSVTLVYDDCIDYGFYSCNNNGLGDTELTINSKDVKIQGTYYINGNLSISNTNLMSNAILYVDGDVEIRFSTLKELKKNSSLIIFASGKIFIANISEYSDTPSTIRGFFYSQKDMTLYGVGSNIKVIGGVAAKNLYFTAIRGNVKNNNFDVPVNSQPNLNSRLHILYDENIIKQYTEFNRDEKEEFITQINDPEIMNRY